MHDWLQFTWQLFKYVLCKVVLVHFQQGCYRDMYALMSLQQLLYLFLTVAAQIPFRRRLLTETAPTWTPVTGSALLWTRLKWCLWLELNKRCRDVVVTSQRDVPNELEITRTAAHHVTVRQADAPLIKGWSQIDEQYDYTPKAESHWWVYCKVNVAVRVRWRAGKVQLFAACEGTDWI